MKKIIKSLYTPLKSSHKGENGRLLVIGGSRQYHGAPVFSLLAARRFVDLVYFYPGEKDENLIRAVKRIPEVIVLEKLKNLERFDCILFGIGLNKAKFNISRLKTLNTRLVIDGDGFKKIKNKIPANAILTPHEGEFKFLFDCKGTRENVKRMAERNGCVILKKDPKGDIIADGNRIVINKVHNQGMTKGGTGDVLSGLVAALACKNDGFVSAAAGAYITGYAGNLLKKKLGFSFDASDLADELAAAYQKLRTLR